MWPRAPRASLAEKGTRPGRHTAGLPGLVDRSSFVDLASQRLTLLNPDDLRAAQQEPVPDVVTNRQRAASINTHRAQSSTASKPRMSFLTVRRLAINRDEQS